MNVGYFILLFKRGRKMLKWIRGVIRVLRKRGCMHGVPSDWAFDHYGAVYQGGICPICDKLNRGKFLGNLTGYMKFFDEEKKEFVSVGNVTEEDFIKKGWKLRSLPIS